MKFEKSAGAIVFRERGARDTRHVTGDTSLRVSCPVLREYLLLAHNSMGKEKKVIWDFPKGLIAEGETERGCVQREVTEETGLSEISWVDGFREPLKIFYKYQGEFINKTVIYFLSQTTSDEVQISSEHTDFSWLRFNEAVKRLSFKNSRELLTKAENFLSRGPASPQLNLFGAL